MTGHRFAVRVAAGDVPSHIVRRRKMQVALTDLVGAIKTALDPLCASLSDEQNQATDELFGHLPNL